MKKKAYRGEERSEGGRKGERETVNPRRPNEKGALALAAAPLLQWARRERSRAPPGLSRLWEALCRRSQAGPGTLEVSGATAPLQPILGATARRHPRLAPPAGTSALPAEGNRHKAAAHTMAGRAMHAAPSAAKPPAQLHSHLGNEGR